MSLAIKSLKAPAAALVTGSFLVWSAVAQAASPPDSFADLAEEVSPAVVNISSTRAPDEDNGPRSRDSLPFDLPPGSPFEDFFRQFEEHFKGMRPQQHQARPATSLGSGFIIDAEGYVVTNNHVIDKADDIRVKLSDGRDLEAEVIGRDPKTDLALLKISSDKDLPHVTMGDSDDVRVGDWVMAVGNPFGLGGSVTAGIISARSRDINAGPYDDFLQTDAAINRGNSGGPMFNMDGDVIGISTAIFSPSGGSVGIGFAIPSNLASDVITQLREKGEVERGWLGVRIQQVTPELAEGLSLDEEKGALVASVESDGPADRAGIRTGDVILEFDGEDVERMRDLPRLVAAVSAGQDVEIVVWRDGEEETLNATIAEQTEESMAAFGGSRSQPGSDDDMERSLDRLGASLSSLDKETRNRLGLPEDMSGVVVTDVDPDGRAAAQGLAPGDVIEQVDGQEVASPNDVAERLEQAERDGKKTVVLLVEREGSPLFLGFRLGDA
ncbi:DegQ family serine endoprotease [Fodinicurvata sediminis]|uniref:DegQ family serine endoprotease n=1 Tax=Fodinicurvata sediminis TaxID=1121832 RepID=UPI0003B32D55|nr:DegQ family serine endoprotease [Fodinicurvata sediminis]